MSPPAEMLRKVPAVLGMIWQLTMERGRVDKKRYGGQHYHHTTRQQKNLPGFCEVGKFALKRNAMAATDQRIAVRETERKKSNYGCPFGDVQQRLCSDEHVNPRRNRQEECRFNQRDAGNAFPSIYTRCPRTRGGPEEDGEGRKVDVLKKSKHRS